MSAIEPICVRRDGIFERYALLKRWRKAVETFAPTPIEALPEQGLASVEGIVRPLGPLVTEPWGGRQVVAYRVVIGGFGETFDAFATVACDITVGCDFEIEDASGRMRASVADCMGLFTIQEITDDDIIGKAQVEFVAFLMQHRIPMHELANEGTTVYLLLGLLMPGSYALAMGHVRPGAAMGDSGYREAPARQRLLHRHGHDEPLVISADRDEARKLIGKRTSALLMGKLDNEPDYTPAVGTGRTGMIGI